MPIAKFASPAATAAVHSATLITFMAASSAPTPLYRLYQQAWHFSPTVLTVIFAAYALTLLLALLIAGRLSDYLGRRPVIAAALLLECLAMAVFIAASGPAWLLAARIVQGLATGLAAASAGAALLDLHRERGALINSIAPMAGMGIGALGSSALLAFLGGPLNSVYTLLLAVLLALLAATGLTPETGVRHPGALASLKPNVSLPPQTRAAFWAVTPANVAVWMLGGFYLSLMPSLIAATVHNTSPWLSGLSVATLTLCGSAGVLAARRAAAAATLLGGAVFLLAGLLLMLGGAHRGDAAWLLGGSAVAGVGFGAAFLGAVRTVLPLAEPQQRAGLMAVLYISCYLANSIPAIAAGYLTQRIGLRATADLYGIVIAALTLSAIGLTYGRRRSARRSC